MRLILFTSLILFVFVGPAPAQSAGSAMQQVSEYNRIQPLQNPKYRNTKEILTRRMLDSKNRVIGEVQDVIITRNGSIRSVFVEFDRLRLGAPVYLNYNTLNIRPAGRSYILRMNDDQVEEIYPNLLADIESAAGGEDDLSVENMLGAQISAQDGRGIGTVQDVLFGANGDRAEALYVAMSFGTLRGKSVAIPLTAAAFDTAGSKPSAKISNALADAMIAFAGGK